MSEAEELEKRSADQALMILRKIGVEKIKEDTKLDVNKIEDILQKRFEKLDAVRAKGFIYILEKEYQLDLSAWLEEYFFLYPQEEEIQNQKKNDLYQKEVKKKRGLLFLGIVLILVAGVVCFEILLKKKPLTQSEEKSNPSFEVQIQERQEIQQEAPKQTQNENEQPKLKEEKKDDQPQQEGIVQDSPLLPLKIEKPLEEIGDIVFEEDILGETLLIEAKKPLWVGVVDLESKKRVAFSKTSFEIPLDHSLMICTAYGKFLLKVKDQEKEFFTYKPIYLIYTDKGSLRKISKEEFVALNGGVEW